MLTKEITLLGQYIKDLSFENPMAPNLPSQDINPTINLSKNLNKVAEYPKAIIINTGIIIVAIGCIIINIYRFIMRPSCAGSTFSGGSCFIAS